MVQYHSIFHGGAGRDVHEPMLSQVWLQLPGSPDRKPEFSIIELQLFLHVEAHSVWFEGVHPNDRPQHEEHQLCANPYVLRLCHQKTGHVSRETLYTKIGREREEWREMCSPKI